MTSWVEIMSSKPLFKGTLALKSPRIAYFAEIIKFAIILIKTTLKDSIKVKIIRNHVLC